MARTATLSSNCSPHRHQKPTTDLDDEAQSHLQMNETAGKAHDDYPRYWLAKRAEAKEIRRRAGERGPI